MRAGPVRGAPGLLHRQGLVRTPCKPRVSGHFPAGAVLLVQPRVRKRFRTICKGEPKQNQWFNAVGPLHLQRLSLQLAGQSAGSRSLYVCLNAPRCFRSLAKATPRRGARYREPLPQPQRPFAPRVPASTGSLRPQCPQCLSCDPLPQASKRDRYALLPAAFVRPPAGSARPAYVARRPVMSPQASR